MRIFVFTSILVATLACSPQDQSNSPNPEDIGPITSDSGTLDVGFMDGGYPDVAPIDAALLLDIQMNDAASMDAGLPQCPEHVSERSDRLVRTRGCDFVRGENSDRVLLRGVVVSADNIETALSTSPHEAAHFLQLEAAGADFVWLLAQWRGVEPFEDQYDGAYMRRLCRQGKAAKEAGLIVFLGLYQEGQAGFPRWFSNPNNLNREARWGRLWGQSPEKFVQMWKRLLDTCQDTELELDGVQLLTAPASDDLERDHGIIRDAFQRVYDHAVEQFGPLVLLSEPVTGEGRSLPMWLGVPDEVYAPAIWSGDSEGQLAMGFGPGTADELTAQWTLVQQRIAEYRRPTLIRGVVGSWAEGGMILPQVEAEGVSLALWHDGFGTPNGIRDEDGAPTPEWDLFFGRPWPHVFAGDLLGFGRFEDLWFLQWNAVPGPNLFRVRTGVFAPPFEVHLSENINADVVFDYDPIARLLTVFVADAIGMQRMEISGDWPSAVEME